MVPDNDDMTVAEFFNESNTLKEVLIKHNSYQIQFKTFITVNNVTLPIILYTADFETDCNSPEWQVIKDCKLVTIDEYSLNGTLGALVMLRTNFNIL